MGSQVFSAILAAAFALVPVASGFAPAQGQDFTITNKLQPSIRVEGVELGEAWTKKLQAWWNLHAYYPREASEKQESGTVKLHMVFRDDGLVWTTEIEEGSGSKSLDLAGYDVFHNALLVPFPPGTPAPQAHVHITLHYVLAPGDATAALALSKRPFTVTNAPVHDTVVDVLQEKYCVGSQIIEWIGPPNPWFGTHVRVTAVFYRGVDGKPWLKWTSWGGIVDNVAVSELGVSAQWKSANRYYRNKAAGPVTQYKLWPDGENHVSGRTSDPHGTISLTCEERSSTASR